MGIKTALDKITQVVIDTLPIQQPNEPFEAIDANGAGPVLEEEAKTRDRVFDLGTSSYPEDDGEAGGNCNRLRARVELLLRVGYKTGKTFDKRALDVLIAEDIRRIITSLMNPNNRDYPTTGILGLNIPGQPFAEDVDGLAVIVNLPFTMIYREDA